MQITKIRYLVDATQSEESVPDPRILGCVAVKGGAATPGTFVLKNTDYADGTFTCKAKMVGIYNPYP